MRLLLLLLVPASVVVGCVLYEDRCLGVGCDTGEVCIDLASGPTCVCDDFHEDQDGQCVPFEDEGSGSG